MVTEVATRPIIFSPDMVKAILTGGKTQTRRVINNPGRYDNIRGCDFCCPYGQVGDRLWVRETFFLGGIKPNEWVSYKADTRESDLEKFVWKPSFFMPRWASRINLEIISVRVQELQEITEEDAHAEGVESYYTLPGGKTTARYHFSAIWDIINAKRGYGWETNPWVWVIEFRKL